MEVFNTVDEEEDINKVRRDVFRILALLVQVYRDGS